MMDTSSAMTRSLLRPPGFDDLGVKRALSDRLLPSLVGAMAFLAALALAGAVGATALAEHWQQGAGGTVTVQVPQPGAPGAPLGVATAPLGVATASGAPLPSAPNGAVANGPTRLDRIRATLAATPGIRATHILDDAELQTLLRPWLGTTANSAIPLPAVIEIQLTSDHDIAHLATQLDTVAPGTLVEAHDRWLTRLTALARSLQACAALALAVVAFVAVAVIAVATRAGLASRRDAIETVYGLGATDNFIARSFAQRATILAGTGAGIGTLAALPVLAGLVNLAAPFGNADAPSGILATLAAIPPTLWLGVVALPPLAALIGWTTAQRTVRRWLRRLP